MLARYCGALCFALSGGVECIALRVGCVVLEVGCDMFGEEITFGGGESMISVSSSSELRLKSI